MEPSRECPTYPTASSSACPRDTKAVALICCPRRCCRPPRRRHCHPLPAGRQWTGGRRHWVRRRPAAVAAAAAVHTVAGHDDIIY